MTNSKSKKLSRKELIISIALVSCIVFIAVWEVAAKLAATPFDELKLKPEDFSGFIPNIKQWDARLVHMKSSPTEPTVIGYKLSPRKVSGSQWAAEIGERSEAGGRGDESNQSSIASMLFSRIVHGYNMVDCMRIKQYEVELLLDTRSQGSGGGDPSVALRAMEGRQRSEVRGLMSDCSDRRPATSDQHTRTPIQVWKITSSIGESSIWVTTMLRSADFAVTAVDTRDMAFPRVGSPDDPSWAPSGLKWSSFRHPIRNARAAILSRWNSSRCDLLTFLRLRQPAWASDEMLTMVTEYHGPPILPKQEKAVMQYIIQAHYVMLNEFQKFWQTKMGDG